MLRVTVCERAVEGGEEATSTSREADEVGICDVAVAVDRGQVCVDVGDPVTRPVVVLLLIYRQMR